MSVLFGLIILQRVRSQVPSSYKVAVTPDPEKENLAREALNLLNKVPESAKLRTICKTS